MPRRSYFCTHSTCPSCEDSYLLVLQRLEIARDAIEDMLFSVSLVSPSLARVAFLICLTFVLQQPGVLALETKRPFHSTWYDLGWYGLYPQRSYQSSGLLSPLFNFRTWHSECDDHGYVLLEPRGLLVTQPGPVIMDKQGNLVWKGAEWGEVMDFKVQVYQGQQVLTFWVGEDSGTFGQGRYIIVRSMRML